MRNRRLATERPTIPELPLERRNTAVEKLRMLVVTGSSVRTVELERGILLIGRSPDAQVRIDEPNISRRHARLNVGEDLLLEDCGSANGTFLRGVRLNPGGTTSLAVGDSVELGTDVTLLIQPSKPGVPPCTEQRKPSPPDMETLYRLAERVARASICVVLEGETGVGKEVLARQIHGWSTRSEASFVALNCSAFTESLLTSELFGHEKGSFTGATAAKIGLLESAQGGTVFLDEVGDMPLGLQAKLLRVIEQREVLPVGAVRSRPIDVRFLAATNRQLDDEVREGRFREDLYFRLNGITITIPPLRQRQNEIEDLVAKFLNHFDGSTASGDGPSIRTEALEKLRRYAWPGNIRELKNVIERAVVVSGGEIHVEHLPEAIRSGRAPVPPGDPDSVPTRSPPIVGDSKPQDLREAVEDVERLRIVEALDKCGGNQTRAAKLLGIARGTLISRMERYGIRRPRKS